MIVPAPLFATGPSTFDGSTNSAVVEPHAASFLLPAGTLEFDFVADQVDGRRFLFSKDSGGFDNGGHLGVYIEDGAVVVRIQSTDSTVTAATTNLITTGRQHHVVVTFGAADGLTIYVDGNAVITNGFTGGLIQNQEPIVLGANQWASGDFVANSLIDPFDGVLTRFALYDGALGANEVGALFSAATGDPDNTPPTAQDDTAETSEDVVVAIDVLANDSDPDGDTLAVANDAEAGNGTVEVGADGLLTYTPDPDFNGIDTLTYTIDDGRGGRETASVSVTVNAVNDAPVINDAAFQIPTTPATNDIVGQVPATDVDGDALSYAIIAGDDVGAFGIDSSGTIFVVDNSALNPTSESSFTLTVSVTDGALSDTASVSIDVSDSTVPSPILEASSLAFNGNTNGAQVIQHADAFLLSAGTLEFDFVADAVNGRRFLFSKDSGGFDDGGHAGVYIENGSVVARFQSTTQTFVAESANLISAGTRHHIAVTFGGPEGLTLFVDGVAAASNAYDGGLLGNLEPIVLGANQWASGNLIANNLIDAFDGELTRFALYSDMLSADQIAGLANDAISVPGNNGPVAADDVAATNEDEATTINVLSNDVDPDGDTLDVTSASADTGDVNVNLDGTLTYTPDADFNGTDTITYTIDDRRGGTDTATVSVTVAAMNDAPAIEDAVFTAPTTVQTNDVVGTVVASDIDGDPLTFAISDGNASGAFAIDNSGNLLVADAAALAAASKESFLLTVDVFDGEETATAAVTVNVTDSTIQAPLVSAIDLSFDGSIGDAQILPHVDAYLVPEGTLEFEFTADAVNGRRFLFSKDSGGFDEGGHLGVYVEDGQLIVRLQSTTATFLAESAELIVPGQAYHLAVTFGTAGLTVYLDGQEVAGNAFTGGLILNEEPIVLGANQWASGNLVADNLIDAFNGEISQFALYGESLNADEILELIGDSPPPPTNTAPVLDAAMLVLDEGQSDAGTIMAADADDDVLTFALTDNAATDNPFFTIDPVSGLLSFLAPPDFETAQDANGDNVYVVEVQVDDGNGGVASGQFNVTVNNVGEAVLVLSDADPFDFGSVLVAGSFATTFAVTNIGDGDATNVGSLLPSSVFDITGGTLLLDGEVAAGAVETIDIEFVPSSLGAAFDTLEISYFDGLAFQSATKELQGTGLPAPNSPPIAVDDDGAGDEDTVIEGNVLANDSDLNNDGLTARLISDVNSGTLTLNANGSFAYTPAADFNGMDGFTYVANDGNEDSAEATVTITVNPVNDAPVAMDNTVPSIPDGVIFNPDNGHFYYLVSDPLNWEQASNNAAALGGHLATVTSESEQAFLQGAGAIGWLGGSDATTEGEWTWVEGPEAGTQFWSGNGFSGVPVNGEYSNWGAFEPNGGTTENFAAITPLGTWNDARGTLTGLSVVEFSDIATPNEDTPLTIDVLTNDIDADGDALTVSSAVASNGAVDINPDGTLAYTPNENFNGTDTVVYSVDDGNGGTDTADVTVFIKSINDAPVASNTGNTTTVDEGTVITGALPQASDVDDDAATLTYELAPTLPPLPPVVINSDGTFEVTPPADFNGDITFDYIVRDPAGAISDVQTFTVTVSPVNDAPTFEASSFTIDEGQTVAGTIMATDVDGDALTFALTNNVNTDNALFTIDAVSGALNFLAPPDFENAQDANSDNVYVVEVQADDGNGGISSGQFNVTVNNVGEALLEFLEGGSFNYGAVALGQTFFSTLSVVNSGDADATNIDDTLELPFVAIGGSLLTDGELTAGEVETIAVRFQPDIAGSFSEDLELSYFDGVANQSVTIELLGEGIALNTPPVAADDTAAGDEDAVIRGNVLDNDSDPDGDPLRATLLAGPANGTVDINDSGNYAYTPDPDFNGTDAFTYTLEDLDLDTGDPLGPSDIGTVTITVNPVNDAPVASPIGNSLSGDENTVINGTLPVASDVDDDVSTLTYELAPALPPLPPVVIEPDGTFEITPPADFVGDITFDYIVRDPSGAISVPQTFTVTVSDANTNAVIAGDLTGIVTEDVDLIATGVLSITDPDAGEDQLVAQIDTASQFGTFSVTADGAWSYALDNTLAAVQALAASDAPLTDTFQVTSVDGTATETVSLTINGIDEPPVVTDPPADTNPAVIDEDATAIFSGISVALPDQPGGMVNTSISTAQGIVALTQSDGLVFTDSDGSDGMLAFSGSTTDVSAALANSIAFTPTTDFDGTATINVTFDDGGNNGSGIVQSASTLLNVDVAAVADVPIITIGSANGEVILPVTGPVLVNNDAGGNNFPSSKLAVLTSGNVVVSTFDQGDVTTLANEWFVDVFTPDGDRIVTIDLGLTPASVGVSQIGDVVAQRNEPVFVSQAGSGFFIAYETSEGVDLPGGGAVDVASRIRGQFFDANGNQIGTDQLVVPDQLRLEDIDTLSNGNILLTWRRNDTDQNTFATLLSSSGQILQQEIAIEAEPTLRSLGLKVAPANDGGFVVASVDFAGGTLDGNAIRIFDASGQQTGSFTTTISLTGVTDSIAQLANGNIAVMTPNSVQQQLTVFDTAGSIVAFNGGILDNLPGSPNFISGAWLEALEDGTFLATWRIEQTGANDGIYLQRFSADATEIGEALQFDSTSTASGPVYSPEVAVAPDGRITVFWTEAFTGVGSQTGLSYFQNFIIAAPGTEDTPLAVPVSIATGDTDGSETIVAAVLTGLPAGFVLSDDANSETSDGTTPISILGWSLTDLVITPALNFNGPVSISITATSEESSNADQASTTETADVSFAAVDDAPIVTLPAVGTNPVVIDEDTTAIISGITVELPDAPANIIDATITTGSGAVALTQSAGLSFSDADGSDGTLTFSGTAADITTALANSIAFTPIADLATNASIGFLFTNEGDTASVSVPLAINAVADQPIVEIGALPVDETPQLINEQQIDNPGRSDSRFDVAALSNGDAIVTWNRSVTLPNDRTVFTVSTQLIDANGQPVGGPQTVASDTGNVQPSIASGAVGGAATVHVGDIIEVGSQRDVIVATLLDNDGTVLGTNNAFVSENLIGQSFGAIFEPDIASLANGDYVVSWTETVEQLGDAGRAVRAQIIDASGFPIGDPIAVSGFQNEGDSFSSVTGLANGGFVAAWDGPDAVFARVFDSSGAALSGPVQASFDTTSPLDAQVIGLAGGGFVVGWNGTDGTSNGTLVQLFDDAGNRVGDNIIANTTTVGSQSQPALTALSDGGFLASFNAGLAAQRFDAQGNMLGAEFPLTARTATSSELVQLDDGAILTVWQSFVDRGGGVNDTDIFTSTFSLPPAGQQDTPVALPISVTLADIDGSESIVAIELAGLPSGFVITDGTSFTTSDGTTAISVLGWSLADLIVTPTIGFTGPITLSLTATSQEASNANQATTVASVGIEFVPTNDTPIATDDLAATDEDTPITINARANDIDPDGDALTIASVEGQAVADGGPGIVLASGATVSLIAGDLVYDPVSSGDLQALGVGNDFADSFAYTVDDGNGATASATVSVTVLGLNDVPIANDDTFVVDEDTTLSVGASSGVLSNDVDDDGDNLTATLVTDVSNGTLSLSDDGSFDYTANPNFFGSDSFVYVASDGLENSNETTVSITVNDVLDLPDNGELDNDPPTAGNITLTGLSEGQSNTFNFGVENQGDLFGLGLVSDPDGSVVSIGIVDQAQFAGISSNGVLVTISVRDIADGLPPQLSDSFSYRAFDDDGRVSEIAEITLQITQNGSLDLM